MLRQLVQAEVRESKDVRYMPRIGAQITKEETCAIDIQELVTSADDMFP